MEFEYIEKKEQGRFINRYDVHYKMVDGNEKVYEMISRNPDLKNFEDLQNGKEDAVARREDPYKQGIQNGYRKLGL